MSDCSHCGWTGINYCENERPKRKVFCQKKAGHKGECRAVIFWKKKVKP